MIIVVSWFTDGSDGAAGPEVTGIPEQADSVGTLVRLLHRATAPGKEFRVFRVETIEDPLIELGGD